jgi:WD40 repeat protein
MIYLTLDVWRYQIAPYLSTKELFQLYYTCHGARAILMGLVLPNRVYLHPEIRRLLLTSGALVGRNVSFPFHNDKGVRGICFSQTGLLVIFSSYSTISIWDPKDWSNIGNPSHYGKYISSMCPMSDKIAVGASNNIQIWDVDSMKMTMEIPVICISSLCKDSHGMLVSGQYNGMVKIWNPITGQLIRDMSQRHNAAVTSLALDQNGMVVSASDDRTIMVWDTLNGVCKVTLNRFDSRVVCLCSLIGGGFATGHEDGKIMRWTIFAAFISAGKILEGHASWVTALCQLPDGRLVSGGKDKQIRVWNIDAGTCLRVIRVHLYSVNHLVVHPDGLSIVSCSSVFAPKCIHVTALN